MSIPGLAFVDSPRPDLDTARVVAVLRDAWGIAGEFDDVGGDRDQNIAVRASNGARYLAKIAQPGEQRGVIDLQLTALQHLATHAPDLPLPRVMRTRAGEAMTTVTSATGEDHIIRMFTYLPGRPLLDHKRPPALLHAAGGLLARIDRGLQGLFHAHAGHDLLWDPRQAPALRVCTDHIRDPDRRDRVRRLLDCFCQDTLPRLAGLPSQVIHGDATAENLLAGEHDTIAGLIDFGDTVHGPRCQELAVAMADATWGMKDPWAAACQLASGFDAVLALEDEEIDVLHDVARARLVTCVVVMAARSALRAEGLGSMAASVEPLWRQLEALDSIDSAAAGRQLRHHLRAPIHPVPAQQGLLERRRRRRLPGLSLFYPEEPLQVVRGQGMWLIDADGRHYLDCYNNVPQVGHGHPHVLRAINRQAEALNTNTRYLYDSIIDYTDALAARLPGDLGVALFVNSGSEANDLAWQIAQAYTGNTGALVTRHAYHGGTEATAALSPYGRSGLDSRNGHVAHLAVPDGHRTADTTTGTATTNGTADAATALQALAARGHDPAALLVDPLFASDGLPQAPKPWLREVVSRVRRAGGLLVSDEVQAGFGRLGSWWGFETHGVTPDIVTLGKPVANGHPMGVVVTTPDILAAFTESTEYFSTFGGNPVACMAGLAVIDVIEREDLRHRAIDTGEWLRQRLQALQNRLAVVAAVRGRGLFLGVELMDESGGPAPELTARIALELRRRRILVGIEGPAGSMLKIRPPLVCERHHADRLVNALAETLHDC